MPSFGVGPYTNLPGQILAPGGDRVMFGYHVGRLVNGELGSVFRVVPIQMYSIP